MNFENGEPKINYYGQMMNDWLQIQQLGRNDVENSVGPEIIRQVNDNQITAEEGAIKMRALLESKQIH